MCLDRLDEAEAAFKQAEERKLEGEGLLEGRYTLDFLRGDAEGMARVAASAAADKPFFAFALQGSTEAYILGLETVSGRYHCGVKPLNQRNT
jgi:hypothetical protein